MILYIYYPHDASVFFTVVVDVDWKIYWQASQVFRILRINTKGIGRLLARHFAYETVYRSSDLKASKKSHFYYLTPDQVRVLLSRERPNPTFERWFEDVLSGRQLLAAQDSRKFEFLTKKAPFVPRGFASHCVDRDPDNGLLSWTGPPPPQTSLFDFEQPPPSVGPPLRHAVPDPRGVFSLPDLLLVLPQSSSPTPPPASKPRNDNDDEDPYRMQVDESKSFVMEDARFGASYKFHALPASWLSGSGGVSMAFWPFLKLDHENNYFLYVPVKKTSVVPASGIEPEPLG